MFKMIGFTLAVLAIVYIPAVDVAISVVFCIAFVLALIYWFFVARKNN